MTSALLWAVLLTRQGSPQVGIDKASALAYIGAQRWQKAQLATRVLAQAVRTQGSLILEDGDSALAAVRDEDARITEAQLPNLAPLVPVPWEAIDDQGHPERLPIVAQAGPSPDGSRVVGFLDGHVERLGQQDWNRLVQASGMPVKGFAAHAESESKRWPDIGKLARESFDRQETGLQEQSVAASFLAELRGKERSALYSWWNAAEKYADDHEGKLPPGATVDAWGKALAGYGESLEGEPFTGAPFRLNTRWRGKVRFEENLGYILASPQVWPDGRVAALSEAGIVEFREAKAVFGSGEGWTKGVPSPMVERVVRDVESSLSGIPITDLPSLAFALKGLNERSTKLLGAKSVIAHTIAEGYEAVDKARTSLPPSVSSEVGLLTAFAGAKAQAQQSLSLSRLRQIGLATQMYTLDTDAFPRGPDDESWHTALQKDIKLLEIGTMPLTGLPYAFNSWLAGKSSSAVDPDTPLACEPVPFPGGTRAVVQVDGRAIRMTESQFRTTVLPKFKGHKPLVDTSVDAAYDVLDQVNADLAKGQVSSGFQRCAQWLKDNGSAPAWLTGLFRSRGRMLATSLDDPDGVLAAFRSMSEPGQGVDPELGVAASQQLIMRGQLVQAAELLGDVEPQLAASVKLETGIEAWQTAFQLRVATLQALGRRDGLIEVVRKGAGLVARILREAYIANLEAMVHANPEQDGPTLDFLLGVYASVPLRDELSRTWTPESDLGGLAEQSFTGSVEPSISDYGPLIQLALATGRPEEAIRLLDSLKRLGLDRINTKVQSAFNVMRAQADLMAGRPQAALDDLGPGSPETQEVPGLQLTDFAVRAQALRAVGRHDEALATSLRLTDLGLSRLSSVFAYSNERDMSAFLGNLRGQVDLLVSLLFEGSVQTDREAALEAVLNFKGAAFRSQVVRQSALRAARDDPELRSLDARYQTLLHRMEAQPNLEGEKALAGIATAIGQRLTSKGVDIVPPKAALTDAIARLGPDEAAVEIVRFRNVDVRGKAQAEEYAAFVVVDRKVDLVKLGAAEAIDADVLQFVNAMAGGQDVRGERVAQPGRSNAAELARGLYSRLWEPLAASLGGRTSVVLAGDSCLLGLPWAALTAPDGTCLVQKTTLSQVTGLRDLATKPRGQAAAPPLVVAGPDFDQGVARPSSRPWGHWQPLKGAQLEGRDVVEALGNARELSGSEATEKAWRAVNSPSSIHLATHGFYLGKSSGAGVTVTPDAARTGPAGLPNVALAENPLLRTGFVLAGANRAGPGSDTENDGLVTAQDVASMNLEGTDLVVLSACNSGMGDIAVADGMFGLPRAFFQAGARRLIVSLFPVPDEATRRLMKVFYAELRRGQGPREALRASQLAVMAEKGSKASDWAAFVCLGR